VSDKEICGDTHPGLEWLGGGQELVCSLPPGHRWYHWGGLDGLQPWPRKKGFIHILGPDMLPNDQIGIRPYGGFCTERHLLHGECQLRWRHPGPCASPGKIWKTR
jgi:hypothetical protein